jgi:hypothetical protein
LPAVAVLLIAIHAWIPVPSFCDYGFRPYPKLPAALASIGQIDPPSRTYAVAPLRSLSPEFAFSMAHQLPTVWGWYAFEGYDPLVSQGPRFSSVMQRLWGAEYADRQNVIAQSIYQNAIVLESLLRQVGNDESATTVHFVADFFNPCSALTELKKYGVRTVVDFTGPQLPENSAHFLWHMEAWDAGIQREIRSQGNLIARAPGVDVYELDGAAPMAFAAADPNHPLPIKFSAAGFTLDTAQLKVGGKIVINILPAKWLRIRADGVFCPASADAQGRILLDIPPGTRQVVAKYSPPWQVGAAGGVALAACAALAMFGTRRRIKKSLVDATIDREIGQFSFHDRPDKLAA